MAACDARREDHGDDDDDDDGFVARVEIQPRSANVVVGSSVQFAAIVFFENGLIGDATSFAEWSASSAAVVVTSGLATALAEGSVTVEASFGGETGAATLDAE